MAEKDLSQKALQEYPDVFADIFNALVFGGREVLEPDSLRQIETESIALPGGNAWKQLYRDVFMEHTVTGMRFMILGIENQAAVDRTMPLRCMGIDYAAYEKQIRLLNGKSWKGRKVQKLIPVVTLVLYYGEAKWTGPDSLLKMLMMPGESDYPGISRYIHDYGMNLVTIKDLSEEEESRFQSDFKYLIKYIRNCQNPKRQLKMLKETAEPMGHATETMLALEALSKDGRFRQLARAGEQKEERTMCKMLDLLEERGEARGEVKGMVSMCCEFGLSKEEAVFKLCKKLCVQEAEAASYVEQFWKNA